MISLVKEVILPGFVWLNKQLRSANYMLAGFFVCFKAILYPP